MTNLITPDTLPLETKSLFIFLVDESCSWLIEVKRSHFMPNISNTVLLFIFFTCSSPEIQKASPSCEEEEEDWLRLGSLLLCCGQRLWGLLCCCCPWQQRNLSGIIPRNRDNTQGSPCDFLRVTQTLDIFTQVPNTVLHKQLFSYRPYRAANLVPLLFDRPGVLWDDTGIYDTECGCQWRYVKFTTNFFTFIRKVYNLQAVHLEAEGRFNIGDTKDNLEFWCVILKVALFPLPVI